MKSRNIIAILRGVRPSEVIQIGNILVSAGINVIEVPLNSPDPFDSITKLKTELGDSAKIGAGTVLTVEDVSKLKDAGCELVVSPNCDIDVIKATKVAGMKSYPGVFTPTECFAALRAGADGLKFFPGSLIGPTGVSAMKAVLPAETVTYVVGGADASNFAEWASIGVTGFGIGSALYKAGLVPEEIAKNAVEICHAYDEAMT
ncbi:MAG: 2-dehydro-3-deoxy-6-phosphogalactonate aldolase [Tateyamaria sp.]|nr:2-dehydro-3-deoxy-6-phosphogalactonate aldolase [Tateyamaria sp.]